MIIEVHEIMYIIILHLQHCASRGQDWDCALVHYYDRLAHYQTSGETITLQTLQNIFTQIQTALAPPTLLKEWAEQTFTTTMDFWTFRKQVSIEYITHENT